ncbi:hypothetical protein FI667_g7574, partial [Globisporangium splendens]
MMSDDSTNSSRQRKHVPFVFQTTSIYIDQLNHLLLSKFGWYRKDIRLYAARYYSRLDADQAPLKLCHPDAASSSTRPLICDHHIPWEIDFTSTSTGGDPQTMRLKIADHISARLSTLERQYPNLQFDLTLLTTQFGRSSLHQYSFVPKVYFRDENIDVVMLIRGRRCEDPETCKTVLIDDYRYERGIMSTNGEEWYNVTRCLRAVTQFYVWVRVLCVRLGCYFARRHEASCLLHALCETVWMSVNGAVKFEFLTYVHVASVQMRNVWLIALVVKFLVTLQVYSFAQRSFPWLRQYGLLGIRGGLIGMTSSVTIFAYFRVSTFRNTKIVAAGILPPESLRLQRLFSSSFENASEFGLFYDVRAIFAASVAILVAILVVKVFLMGTRVWARPSHCQTLSDASKLNHSTQVAIFRSYDHPYGAFSDRIWINPPGLKVQQAQSDADLIRCVVLQAFAVNRQ